MHIHILRTLNKVLPNQSHNQQPKTRKRTEIPALVSLKL